MSDSKDDGSWYVKHDAIHQSPKLISHVNGTRTVSLGFPVLLPSEWVGAEALETVVHVWNAHDALVEALEFYADRDGDGYRVDVTNYGLSTEEGDIVKDGGDRARAALAKAKAQP